MQRIVLFLVIAFNTSCYGQAIFIDTTATSKLISEIDNLENTNPNYGKIIIWKYQHHELKIFYEVSVDTLSGQIYKFDYLNLTEYWKDTTLERTSYYLDSNQFVAIVVRTYYNKQLLSFQCNYIKTENDDIKMIIPVHHSTCLNLEKIKYEINEIRIALVSVKKHLNKK
jgi:hypothetical protein